MKYKRIKTDCFQVIPVKGMETLPVLEKQSEFKQIIHTITHMNDSFTGTGKAREGKELVYKDEPNFSFKLHKTNGKINQYVTFPQDQKKPLRPQLQASILSDMQSVRLVPVNMSLSDKNLYSFSIQGLEQYAVNLDQNFHQQIKSLIHSTGKDDLLYSLTMKEAADHSEKRLELLDLLAGKDPQKRYSLFNQSKKWISKGAKFLYKELHDESEIEKHQELMDRLKEKRDMLKGLVHKKTDELVWTNRKIAENRYSHVELLFLLWTDDQEKAQLFQSKLQNLMEEIQGDNTLEVVEVKPNLERIQKGQLQYDVLPQLCLYQRELSQFLYIPTINEIDQSFYFEQIQKTEIPKEMFTEKIGAMPFARCLNSNSAVSLLNDSDNIEDLMKTVIMAGEQGSGKSTFIINSALEFFAARAKSYQQWKRYARSVVLFDVADGAMIPEIMCHIPDYAKDRVIVLNHADLKNIIPLSWHEVFTMNEDDDGIYSKIAQIETDFLMKMLDDKSKTQSIERYFKHALQMSYRTGEGNLLDAIRILKDKEYRDQLVRKLNHEDFDLTIEMNLFDKALEKDERGIILDTIENRISKLRGDKRLFYSMAQKKSKDLDFWRWINGDEGGAYMVLIHLPNSNERFQDFAFTHYFIKLWELMMARDSIPKPDRKACLVITDEIDRIIKNPPVQNIILQFTKKPRKYRFKYMLSFHDWSSFAMAGALKKDIIKSFKTGTNFVLMKGGGDVFNDFEDVLNPYTDTDFTNLMNMKHSAFFKVGLYKRDYVFQAKLLEPPDMRLEKFRESATIHEYLNTIGCNRDELIKEINATFQKIYTGLENEEEKECQEQQAMPTEDLEKAVQEELAALTNG